MARYRFFYFFTLASVILLVGDVFLVRYLLNPWEYSSHYATYEEAVKEGAISKDWIPKFVPKDAYDIQESHNLSPIDQRLEFSFPTAEQFKTLIDTYQYVPQNVHEKEHLKTSKIIPLQSQDIKSCPIIKANTHLSYYKVPEQEFACLGVDWNSRRAHYIYRCCRK